MNTKELSNVIDAPHGKLIYIPPLPEANEEYDPCIKPIKEIAESILERLPADQKVHDIYCKDLEAIVHIEVEDYCVKFTAKFVRSWEFDESTGDYTTSSDIDKNNSIDGFVKWDHCSNWTFQEDSSYMLHFCDFNNLWQRAVFPSICFILTEKLCPNWDD